MKPGKTTKSGGRFSLHLGTLTFWLTLLGFLFGLLDVYKLGVLSCAGIGALFGVVCDACLATLFRDFRDGLSVVSEEGTASAEDDQKGEGGDAESGRRRYRPRQRVNLNVGNETAGETAEQERPSDTAKSARSARSASSVDAEAAEFFNAPTPIPPRPDAGSRGSSGAGDDSRQVKRARFANCFARAFFQVARADGVMRPQEMAVVDRFFNQKLGFGDDDENLVDTAFAQAESDRTGLDELAEDIRSTLNHSEILLMFSGLYDVATIDGNLDKSEVAVITQLAQALDVSSFELKKIRSVFVPDAPESNYELLGVSSNAPDAEVKKAFHKAVLENHPDRVAHLGEQAAKMATQRFLEIQNAYEAIRKERGF